MAVKRILLTFDSSTHEKLRLKGEEEGYRNVQKYIYELIRKDLIKQGRIRTSAPKEPALPSPERIVEKEMRERIAQEMQSLPQNQQEQSTSNQNSNNELAETLKKLKDLAKD